MALVYLMYRALAMITLENFFASSEALHIVHFRTITEELKQMIRNAEYPHHDPRNLQDSERRREICDEVLQARQYTTLNSHINRNEAGPDTNEFTAADNFQRLRSKSREALPFEQNVAYFKNQGRWAQQTLTLIQCVGKYRKNWYVGFDQCDDRAYLIERMDMSFKTIFKWIALIEKAGQYNNIFSGPKTQELLFQHFVGDVKSDMSRRDPRKSLCFLSLNEHGRLCSAVSESLSLKLRPREVSNFNFINTSQKRCSSKNIDVSSGELIRANVVQCTMNRNRERPQFYLLGDRQMRGAVYVLMHKASSNRVHTLQIVARVQNLSVLREVRLKETTRPSRRRVTTLL